MAKNKESEITALKQAFDEDDLFSDEEQIFSLVQTTLRIPLRCMMQSKHKQKY